ncbi:MAG: DUF5131 family protein [Mariniphaga sp.]
MALNISRGNMYEFITHTWNTVKGECFHDCSYCYMKRFGKRSPIRFDQGELKTDLGQGNYIFVGSSCDMWAENIPVEWITKTLDHCSKHDNRYLFQTKNPQRFTEFQLPRNSVVCTTIETNRWYPAIMFNSPFPEDRVEQMKRLAYPRYITIEPIIDFDMEEFVEMIQACNPVQVNIGSDTGHNDLPEPSADKILKLVERLQKFTVVHNKTNLKRVLNTEKLKF